MGAVRMLKIMWTKQEKNFYFSLSDMITNNLTWYNTQVGLTEEAYSIIDVANPVTSQSKIMELKAHVQWKAASLEQQQ